MDAADPQQLQSAALAANHTLAFESGSLARSIITRKNEVNALVIEMKRFSSSEEENFA